jgi:hypothetical protein
MYAYTYSRTYVCMHTTEQISQINLHTYIHTYMHTCIQQGGDGTSINYGTRYLNIIPVYMCARYVRKYVCMRACMHGLTYV